MQSVKLLLVLRYYITDRKRLPDESTLLNRVERAIAAKVDLICLREKDLTARELERLARRVREMITPPTKLIIHSRADVALAVGADGVHLASGADPLSPSEVRALWIKASTIPPVIVVSCHQQGEVALAESHGADMVVFGPVFQKAGVANPQGLDRLREVCRHTHVQVMALGGVTAENADLCIEAGASGIAGVRMFQG